MTATHHVCPHCRSPLDTGVDGAAVRCPQCRLVVGPGRAVEMAVDGPVGRATSAAALMRLQAGRDDGTVRDVGAVIADLRRAAVLAQIPLSDLRMVDYVEQEQKEGAALTNLADIVATFGGWKAARLAAQAVARAEREQAARDDA